MYEDLKVFIKKIIKEDERYKYHSVYDIDIKMCGEWYDYVAYFTKNGRDNVTLGSIRIKDYGYNLTAGSIRIKEFNKQLRRKKINKLQ